MLIAIGLASLAQAQLTASSTGILSLNASTSAMCSYNSSYTNFTLFPLRDSYNATLKQFFATNKIVAFLNGVTTSGALDLASLTSDTQGIALGAAAYLSYSVIPLLIILFTCPFLMCCCLCDNKCPPKICCRKDEFTGCVDNYCCTSILLVLLLVIIVASAIGVVYGMGFVDSASQTTCHTMRLMDGIYGGRISDKSDSYFIGLVPTSTKLSGLKGALNDINARTSSINTNIDSVTTSYSSYTTGISGDYSGYTNPTYTNAFYASDGTTAVSVTSEFKSLYFGPSTKSGTIYNILDSVMVNAHNGIAPPLAEMKAGITHLNSNIGTLNATIDSAISDIDTLSSSFYSLLSFYTALSPSNFNYGKYGFMGFYLLPLVLAVLLLVATIGVSFFNTNCCKHGLYLFCCLGTVISIIFILFTLVLTLLTPTLYFTCQNAVPLFSSPTSLQKLLNSTPIAKVSSCLAGGSLSDGLSTSFSSSFSKINAITNTSQSFSAIQSSAGLSSTSINRAKELATGVITDVQNNKYYDTTSNDALSHLQRVSAKSYSTTSCSVNLTSDGFVPNLENKANSGIACPSGVAQKTSNCSDLTNVGCTNGCYGFTQQLGTATNNNCGTYNCTASGSVSTQVVGRYGANPACLYSKFLVDLNANYDSARQSNLDSLKTTLTTNTFAAMTNYLSSINTLSSSFSSLNTYISTTAKSILDSQSGIFAGFNCKALNEQILTLLGQVCQGNYSYLIVLHIVSLVITWAFSLALIFTVCVGNKFNRVRAYKESQQVHQDDNPDQILKK